MKRFRGCSWARRASLRGGVGAVRCFVLVMLMALGSPHGVWAADRAWEGDVNANWNNANNWTGTDVPDAGDNAVFNSSFGATAFQPTFNANDTLDAIIFEASLARSVTISAGGQMRLESDGGIGIDNQQSSHAITINNNIRLNSDQTWQGNSMTIAGSVNTDGNDLTMSPDSGATIVLSGIVSGSGDLFQDGAGTTRLSGANTFSGGLTVDSGTVQLGNDSAAGTGTLTLNGGTIEAFGGARSLNEAVTVGGNFAVGGSQNLTLSGAMNLGGATRTVTVDNSGLTTFSGTISGTGGLTKAGAGTLVLSGTNPYDGVTTLNAGTLSVSNLLNGGTDSNIGDSPSAAANLVFNGGTLQYTGAGSTSDRAFTVGTGGATIEANGSGALNLNQTGVLAYSGSGARTITLTGTSTAANNLSADIGNGTGGDTSLVKDGTGTWRISGDNTFGGTATVKNGILEMNSSTINGGVPPAADLIVGDGIGAANSAIARNLQEGQVGNTSTVTVYSDGWFDINAAAYPDKGGVGAYREETVGQINLYGGRITTGNPGSLNIDASLPGAGISSFANSQTALIDATGGLVDFKGLTRTISVEDGSQVTDLEIRGQITNGGVTKTGAGRLSFTGTEANTYTGATTVSGGTLELAKSSGVTSIAGSAITVNSGGTLLLASNNQINNAANLTLNSGILSTGESVGYSETLGTLTLSGTSSIDLGTAAHLLQFANSSALSGSWSGTLTINGWTGIPETSGTSGQIFFGNNASGLTSGQLAMISFTGFGPGAMLLTSGELVPVAVPEPETILAALLIAGAVGCRHSIALRRRLSFLRMA